MTNKKNQLLWVMCLLLAIGGPVYIFVNLALGERSISNTIPEVDLARVNAQDGPYCYDIFPVGDGVGYDSEKNKDCYLDSEIARNNGANPRDYCFDTAPQGDGRGWNAFFEQTCYLGTDKNFGPDIENPLKVDQDLPSSDICVDSSPIDGVGFNTQRDSECYLNSEVARVSGADPKDHCFDAQPVGDGQGYNAAENRTCFFVVDGGTPEEIPIDGTDIAIPTNVRATKVGADSITIVWDGNVSFDGYNIERNGRYLTTVTDGTTFIDEDVKKLQAYIYKVSAFSGG